MLLGAEQLDQPQTLAWQRPLAIGLGFILGIETLYVLFTQANPGTTSTLPGGFGSPAAFGQVLFTQYLLPFEVTSVLLLVAMVGAIVLSKREQ
jgi:NADH-quinone oxidoreductase subunit J